MLTLVFHALFVFFQSFHDFAHPKSGFGIRSPLVTPVKQDDAKKIESTVHQANPQISSFGFEENKLDTTLDDYQAGVVCGGTFMQNQRIAEIVGKSPLDFIANSYSSRSQKYQLSNSERDLQFPRDRIPQNVSDFNEVVNKAAEIRTTKFTKELGHIDNSLGQNDHGLDILDSQINYSVPTYTSGSFPAPRQSSGVTLSQLGDDLPHPSLGKVVGSRRSGVVDNALPKRPKLFTELSDNRLTLSASGNNTSNVQPFSTRLGMHCTGSDREAFPAVSVSNGIQRNHGQAQNSTSTQDNIGAGDGLGQFVKAERLGPDEGQFEFRHGPDGDSVYDGRIHHNEQTHGNGKEQSRSGLAGPAVLRTDFAFSHEIDNGGELNTSYSVANGIHSESCSTARSVSEYTMAEQWNYPNDQTQMNVDKPAGVKKTVYRSSGRSVAGIIDEVRQSREKMSLKESKVDINSKHILSNKNQDSVSSDQLSGTNQSAQHLQVMGGSQVTQLRYEDQKSVEHLTSLGVPLPQEQIQQMRDILSSNWPGSNNSRNKFGHSQQTVSIKQEPIDGESQTLMTASVGREASSEHCTRRTVLTNGSRPTVLPNSARPGPNPLTGTEESTPSYHSARPGLCRSTRSVGPRSSLEHSSIAKLTQSHSDRKMESNYTAGCAVLSHIPRSQMNCAAGYLGVNPIASYAGVNCAESARAMPFTDSQSKHSTDVPYMAVPTLHSSMNPVRKIAGVAPVTPTVRRPMQALSLSFEGANRSSGTQYDGQGGEEMSRWSKYKYNYCFTSAS
jgi:hypothetical protein